MQTNRLFRLALIASFGLLLMIPAVVQACSVCQGDPNNKMVQGAQAGVLFMVITTYILLLGMAGLVASWFIRQNRRLRRTQLETDGIETNDTASSENVAS